MISNMLFLITEQKRFARRYATTAINLLQQSYDMKAQINDALRVIQKLNKNLRE